MVLADVEPKTKAELYAELGITIRYDPTTRIVTASSQPESACTTVGVGGPISTVSDWRLELWV
jgi:hypothetical protein